MLLWSKCVWMIHSWTTKKWWRVIVMGRARGIIFVYPVYGPPSFKSKEKHLIFRLGRWNLVHCVKSLWCYVNSGWKLQMNALSILDWFGCIRRRPQKDFQYHLSSRRQRPIFPPWFGEQSDAALRQTSLMHPYIDWMTFSSKYEFKSFPWKLSQGRRS